MNKNFFRYIIVGVFSAATEVSLLVLFVEYFLFSPLVANVISFCIVNSANYILSRLWVFEKTGSKKRIEIPVFLFFLSCGLLINQAAFWTLTNKFFIDYRVAKVISISFIVAWNFFTRKFIVFRNDKQTISK